MFKFVAYAKDVVIFLLVAYAALTGLFFYSWYHRRWSAALLLVFLLGTGLRSFMAGDRYLHTWDERFHANVAKHIWDHPGTPTLYDDPVLPYDYRDWSSNHVWLSKPVLPFWIVGASIEAFGANEFGLRLPGILLSLLSVWLTSLIGRRLFDERIAILAAFFHTIHGLTLESAGGLVSSDHVDTVFTTCFYAVIYFSLRQNQSPKAWQPYLIGLLTGLAFLSKWIVAFLLAPVVLGLYAASPGGWRRLWQDCLPLMGTALLVALPWPIYLLQAHPIEAHYIAEQLLFPVSTSIQGHGGGPFYYLHKVRIVFGELIYLPLGWLLYRAIRVRSRQAILLLVWLFPILLLSLTGTKRGTYLLPFAPAFFLLTAWFVDFIGNKENWPRLPHWIRILLLILLLVLPIRYSIERLKPLRPRLVLPLWRIEMATFAHEAAFTPDQILLYDEPRAFDALFFYGLNAYPYTPSAEALKKARRNGYRIYRNNGGKYEQVE